MKKLTNDQEFTNWIYTMFEKYKYILFLDKFSIKVIKDDKQDYLGSKVHYPYLDATFLFSDEAVKGWLEDKVKMERCIVHEFCHLVTDPFYCMAIQRHIDKQTIEEGRERLTDHVAQIVNKLLGN